jgi:mono/diheme cytochrome c family protein
MNKHFKAGGVFAGGLLGMALAWAATVYLPERDVSRAARLTGPLALASRDEEAPLALNIEQGRVYYVQVCMDCHGASGDGFGEWAYRVSPRPANLTAARTQARSDETLFRIISDGLPATSMIAWKRHLSESQRHQLVAYIRHLGKAVRSGAAS